MFSGHFLKLLVSKDLYIELSVVIGCRNWPKQEAIKRNKQLVLSVLIF